jgi:hypothetical protein
VNVGLGVGVFVGGRVLVGVRVNVRVRVAVRVRVNVRVRVWVRVRVAVRVRLGVRVLVTVRVEVGTRSWIPPDPPGVGVRKKFQFHWAAAGIGSAVRRPTTATALEMCLKLTNRPPSAWPDHRKTEAA